MYCLNYVITQREDFNNLDELYSTFAGGSGNAFLSKYRLDTAKKYNWEYAIDYLHDSLPEEDKDELLYHYYRMLQFANAKK